MTTARESIQISILRATTRRSRFTSITVCASSPFCRSLLYYVCARTFEQKRRRPDGFSPDTTSSIDDRDRTRDPRRSTSSFTFDLLEALTISTIAQNIHTYAAILALFILVLFILALSRDFLPPLIFFPLLLRACARVDIRLTPHHRVSLEQSYLLPTNSLNLHPYDTRAKLEA